MGGKRAPEYPNWEHCYERRFMRTQGFHLSVCLVRERIRWARETAARRDYLVRYLCRVNELRDSQAAGWLVTPTQAVTTSTRMSMPRLTLLLHLVLQFQQHIMEGLPRSFDWKYTSTGIPVPAVKTTTFVTRRLRPATIVVKDKGMQAQVKTKDKSTQTSAIEQ